MKLHENSIDRTQVTFTKKDISEIFLLGSAKDSSMSNVKSKHLSAKLIGSVEISLTTDWQNLKFDIVGSGDVDLKCNCKIL